MHIKIRSRIHTRISPESIQNPARNYKGNRSQAAINHSLTKFSRSIARRSQFPIDIKVEPIAIQRSITIPIATQNLESSFNPIVDQFKFSFFRTIEIAIPIRSRSAIDRHHTPACRLATATQSSRSAIYRNRAPSKLFFSM